MGLATDYTEVTVEHILGGGLSDKIDTFLQEGTKLYLSPKIEVLLQRIKELESTPVEKREDMRCVISDLCTQVRERDAIIATQAERINELEQWRDDLIRKQNDSRRNTQLGKAIEYAAEKLPLGFQVNVEVEKDAGWIRMYDPDGDEVEVSEGDYLYETIYNAVNIAEAMAERSDRKHGQ